MTRTIHPQLLKSGDTIWWGGQWRTIHSTYPSILGGRTVIWITTQDPDHPASIGPFRNDTDITIGDTP